MAKLYENIINIYQQGEAHDGEQLSSMLLNSRIQLDDDWKKMTDCAQ